MKDQNRKNSMTIKDFDEEIKVIEGTNQCVTSSLYHARTCYQQGGYTRALAFVILNIDAQISALKRIEEEVKFSLIEELTSNPHMDNEDEH